MASDALALRVQRATGDDDAALVAEAIRRPEAFADIYTGYLPRVFSYLRTRSETSEDAADLTQAVFLKAMTSLGRYRPSSGTFASWLIGIARHTAIDAHRRGRTTVPIDGLPPPVEEGERSPEALVLRAEHLSRLRDRLAALEPEKRELLALRFAAGLSSKEIAALVGKSEAATKKTLTRTIASLKEQYDAEPQ